MASWFLQWLALSVVMGLMLRTPVPASTHERRPRASIGTLSGARVDTTADGRLVITMNATGELQGRLTLTMAPGPDGQLTGDWLFVVPREGKLQGRVAGVRLHAGPDGTPSGFGMADLTVTYGTLKFAGVRGFGRLFLSSPDPAVTMFTLTF